MEYCEGGSLLERLNLLIDDDRFFSEREASILMKQIMIALNYSHQNKIVHRDIKLENILFLDKDPNKLTVKLIDFGLSKCFNKENINIPRMKEFYGSAYYVSPELINKDYNEKCDIWAAGVLLFILLTGNPPFYSEDSDKKIFEKIRKYEYSFENESIKFKR